MAVTRRLGDNLASVSPAWESDPRGIAVEDVAREWLQHRIARRLLNQGLNARSLAEALGGSESSWQSKLNGHRKIHLGDLLALAIAVDGNLLSLMPSAPIDLCEFFPPAYSEWLSHSSLDAGMPTFREPSTEADWQGFARAVDDWWRDEERYGRAWAITRQVLVHTILVHSQIAGLESASATAADVGSHIDIDWPSRHTRIRVLWNHESGGRPGSAAVTEWVALASRSLWNLAGSSLEDKIVILAVPRVMAENLTVAAGLAGRGPSDWSLIGLSEAHRLGCESAALASGDVQVQVLQPPTADRFTCLRVK